VADLDAVDLLQVGLDVADAHPARVERDDLVVKAVEAALVLGHDLRFERPLPVARRADPHRPVLGMQRLGRRAVAAVPGPARRRMAALIAEVVGQLGVHRALDQPPGQLGEQAALTGDLRRRARAGEQPVDQLVRKLTRTRAQRIAVGPLLDGRDLLLVDGHGAPLRESPAATRPLGARSRRHDR
jgi:hypothetical protein